MIYEIVWKITVGGWYGSRWRVFDDVGDDCSEGEWWPQQACNFSIREGIAKTGSVS